MTTQHETPERGGQTADAELLELERQVVEARETSARFWKSVSGYSLEEEPAIKKKAGPLDDRVDALECQIAKTPAQGLIGVGVQLRVAACFIREMGQGAVGDLCALSAHEAVERLLKEQEATDAELVETWCRYSALIAEHNAALIAADKAGKTGTDEKADASFAQASELCERILATQARTPAGIAVKLKIAAEVDSMEKYAKEYPKLVVPRAVLSAIADAERLAGGAA